jgi:glutaminyl-tRNA synthetase
VDGWDIPACPRCARCDGRGYTPQSIFEFVRKAGVSKTYSLVDIGLLEF